MHNMILRDQLNTFGAARKPFIFILNFDLTEYHVFLAEKAQKDILSYDINGFSNDEMKVEYAPPLQVAKYPIAYSQYKKAFDYVLENQKKGNSFLTNLTFPTEIKVNRTLYQIYRESKAKYKLYFKNFVVFSPECFIQIKDGKIYSFPMKGTIDAAIPDAAQRILDNEKEKAEHATIVDLIRNDLSRVASAVQVEQYRYIDEIQTHDKTILQISSCVSGKLEDNYHEKIGDIILALLPAGSISGAPKKKTLEIIKQAETHHRGFYTGVFGYFDGYQLDSGVMIRFIEEIDGKMYYKSGGGITVYSDPLSEYKELITKVYVPIY